MNLSIIIVNWNTREYLLNCIDSIFENFIALPQTQFEIFVVDNASKDGSADAVRQKFSSVNVLQMQTNIGFARANNTAARVAQGDFLLFVNPDTIVSPSSISKLVDFLSIHLSTGAVGPRILNPDRSIQISIWPKPTLLREFWRLLHLDRLYPVSQYPKSKIFSKVPQPVDVMMGAFFIIRRSIFEELDGFDEQFFIYSEEVDLFVRMADLNWSLYLIPDAIVTHFKGRSTRQLSEEMFIELYRNKLRYINKHFGDLQFSMYKRFLLIVSITRLIPGYIISKFPISNKQYYLDLHSKYLHLFKYLYSYEGT